MTNNIILRPGKPQELYCITRVLTRRGNYDLNVKVGRQGFRVNKYFTILHYASEEQAFEAARAWRDAVLALLPPMTRVQLRAQPRKNNLSGTPGVHCIIRNKSIMYWVASGGVSKLSFSVKRYGDEQAKTLAIAAREQFLKEMSDSFFVGTQSADAIARRDYGSAEKLGETQRSTIIDASVKAAFMQRLRDAGLLGKPPTPLVQRRHYVNRKSAIWEAIVPFPDGRRKTRRFAVSINGEAEAKRLAEAACAQLLVERDALQE